METRTWELVAALAPPGFTKDALRRARKRGRVPHRWRGPIIEAAKERGLQLTLADLGGIPDRQRQPKAVEAMDMIEEGRRLLKDALG